MAKRTTYHVYLVEHDGELTWISAASREEAWKYVRENITNCAAEDVKLRQLPDRNWLTVSFEDAPPDVPQSQRLRAGEWAKQGPGLVGSTERR